MDGILLLFSVSCESSITSIPSPSFTSWWFQPIWKILVKTGSFPQVGMNIKTFWNHQLFCDWMISIHPPSSKLLAIRPAVILQRKHRKGFLFWKGTTSPKIKSFACAIFSFLGLVVFGFFEFWFLERKGENGLSVYWCTFGFRCFFLLWIKRLKKSFQRIPSLKLTANAPLKIGRNPRGEDRPTIHFPTQSIYPSPSFLSLKPKLPFPVRAYSAATWAVASVPLQRLFVAVVSAQLGPAQPPVSSHQPDALRWSVPGVALCARETTNPYSTFSGVIHQWGALGFLGIQWRPLRKVELVSWKNLRSCTPNKLPSKNNTVVNWRFRIGPHEIWPCRNWYLPTMFWNAIHFWKCDFKPLRTRAQCNSGIHGHVWMILSPNRKLHPWRLTWNIIMEVWKIIFLSKWVMAVGSFRR